MTNKKTPISLLCGYLGAGKTTLLNRVLNNQQGYKVAVIVNDIGEINVDARLIADGAKITDTSSIVPLTNGCICCTLKTQMVQNIEQLIDTGKYDYIMIEASGVCEPMPIAQELMGIQNGFVDNVIGVVDAARLVDEFAGGDALLKDKDEEDIESLLVQQIEFCSTLVVNKRDLVSETDLKKVLAVINAIHPDVKTIVTANGAVDVADILSTNSFDFGQVYESAGWCKILAADEEDHDHDVDHEHSHEHDGHFEHHEHKHREDGANEDEYGIGNMIYYSRAPFDRGRMDYYVSKWPRSIIRSKGIIWFADERDMALLFETSGRQVKVGGTGKWIASAPDEERRRLLEENPQIAAEWDDVYGDRMNKLCIIGKNLDKEKIKKDLDQCLSR